MSKYTTEVRYICESYAGLKHSVGFDEIDSVIDSAIPLVFSFDFPIFDEAYRNVLCKKILMHYYTREIGAETVGLWKLWLRARMNEIMPYYNRLYESEKIKFDPMIDTEVTTTSKRENENTGDEEVSDIRDVTQNSEDETESTSSNSGSSESSVTSTGNNTGRDLYSDTPQGALTGVENETYLTNARKKIESQNKTDNSNSSGSSSGTVSGTNVSESTTSESRAVNSNKKFNSTEDYVQTISGKHGGVSYSKLLREFRETFLNIDRMIIEDLSDLFLNLW